MNATAGSLPGMRAQNQSFYVWMAAAFVLVAFGGFVPTYWAPVVGGTFKAPPIIHVHGMLMFTWVCFFFVQTTLVATGRTLAHRDWGLAGIALFSSILCVILVGEAVVIKHNAALGFGDSARRFAAVTLCAWPLMAGMFVAAIVNVKRPETHKRLMTLLMSGMLTPAIARVFLTLFAPPGAAAGGPPPPFVSIPPALVADLFIVVAMVRDWRTLGKPHAVYVIGGAILLLQQTLTVPFAATDTWMSIVHAFEKLAG
jgi:hypothetical protein